MNETTKRLLIWLYFTRPLSKLTIRPALILIGAGVVLSWTRLGAWLLTAGILYSVALVAAQFLRPSDQKIDDWLKEDVQELREKALKMLDLEEKDIQSSRPLQLAGPLLHTTPHVRREHLRFRRGRDRCYRVSVNRVLILLPTKDYLGVYRVIYDSIRNMTFHPEATEYAYRNVVAVKYGGEADAFQGEDQNRLTTKNGEQVVPTQYFSISISNGESFGVPVRAQVAKDQSATEPPMTELEQTVKAIKKLLQPKFAAS